VELYLPQLCCVEKVTLAVFILREYTICVQNKYFVD